MSTEESSNLGLAEHDFVRTKGWIYRVFGSGYLNYKAPLLPRYLHTSDRWVKPDVYEPELFDWETARTYGEFDRVPNFNYGLSLSAGPIERSEYSEVYSPPKALRCSEWAGLQDLTGNTLGLSGSRLCGLASETSDLDIVVYGPGGEDAARQILSTCTQVQAPIAPSFTLTRVFRMSGGQVPRIRERNIYTGLLPHGEKLDLMFCLSEMPIAVNSTADLCTEPVLQVFEAEVVEASSRQYYPGHLTVRIENAEAIVGFRDHVCAYLLEGDRFTFSGYRLADRASLHAVALSVLDVSLRR